MKVAIYARVSTEEQETENQVNVLRSFAVAKEWELVGIYKETISGAGKVRPIFRDVMEGARKREFDVLLVWSLDRFTREGTFQALSYIQQLNGYGVGFQSYTEQYLDTLGPFRDAVLGIIAAIAAMEKQRISERTKAAYKRKKEKGEGWGRRKGYTANDIRRVMELRNDAFSIRHIAKVLNLTKGMVERILDKEL